MSVCPLVDILGSSFPVAKWRGLVLAGKAGYMGDQLLFLSHSLRALQLTRYCIGLKGELKNRHVCNCILDDNRFLKGRKNELGVVLYCMYAAISNFFLRLSLSMCLLVFTLTSHYRIC